MPTAAAIVIGNEILTGKFADENGVYLIERLRALGADLKRIVVIADDVPTIAAEVRRCSESFDVVFTSGGVGPTHDDVTLEAVGRAFDSALVRHPELVALIEKYGLPVNDASLRMATVPTEAELIREDALSYPVLKVRNVYVLPGVPKLFKAKFEQIAERFAGSTVHTARIYTDERETQIADRLNTCVADHPQVEIGSYPRWGEGAFRVIVTLESRSADALHAAEAQLRACLSVVEIAST